MRRSRIAVVGGMALALFGSWTPIARAAPTLTVDTVEDTFDGGCGDGDCSIRDAIAAVDDGGTVRIPSGFYLLSLGGAGGVEAGDLDVDRPMTITGVGETGAFLDASSLGSRALDIAAATQLTRLTVLGGADVATGGVVRVTARTARIADATLIGGRAADGGAVAVGDGAAVRILGSWVSGSIATERGGALYVRGDATVAGSTISDNIAGAGGGAWVSPTGTLLVRNATVSSNEADRGGGGINARGTVLLRSATVARNRATVAGGVMAVPDAVVTTSSSLFDRNSATGRAPTCSRPLTSEGYNVADATGCGLDALGDLAGVDPLVGGLRQNGGPTPTHALKEGSPAVGNGGPMCPGLDQRGAPRDACDTGAYELVSCLGRPVTIVGTAGHDDLSGGLQRDVFLGRGGNDVFQGSIGEDRACGGRGRDRLIGGPDADRLAGNAGDDVLLGEGGRDLLLGGSGDDVCRGGAGTDVLRRC